MMDSPILVLLADDDQDDCLLFSEALHELATPVILHVVHDGTELLNDLAAKDSDNLPHVIFLDLNMPRKNGQECLIEIRQNPSFDAIPIIIFSTSFDPRTVDMLRQMGANYYIRKPADFSLLKKVLSEVFAIIQGSFPNEANKDKFVLLS